MSSNAMEGKGGTAPMVVEDDEPSEPQQQQRDDPLLRSPEFSVDERVYCKDEKRGKECLYEAVIKKTSLGEKEWKYWVHYLGWNARWDTWVTESSILKQTPERKQWVQQQAASKKRKKRDEEASRLPNKRRTQDGTTTSLSWGEVCELPFTLNTILVEDRERIQRVEEECASGGKWKPTREVHQLPSSVSIHTVLQHFVRIQKKKNEKAPEAAEKKAQAFVNRLSGLFEDALPVCLLYHVERAQYQAVQADPKLNGRRKTEIYGCEFLLRLIVRLPLLLLVEDQTKTRTEMAQLRDLIVLLQKNRQACFKAKYRHPKDDELNDWEKSLMDGATPIAMEDY